MSEEKKNENSIQRYLNALKDQERSFIPREKQLQLKTGGPYW